MEQATIEDIMIEDKPVEHTIIVGGKKLTLWMREPTWANYSEAMKRFLSFDVKRNKAKADYQGYYSSLLGAVLVKADPSIDASSIFKLKAEVGLQIEGLLPSPGELSLEEGEEKNLD